MKLERRKSRRTLADAVTEFVNENDLNGVDAVGSSMVARLVLELARRGGVLTQKGAPRGSIKHPLVIGWGRRDRVRFPSQAKLALEKFPAARPHWFEPYGYFPQWDQPEETTRLILEATANERIVEAVGASAA